MRHLQAWCVVAACLFMLYGIMPVSAQAANPAMAVDVVLTPMNRADTTILVAYLLRTELHCNDSGCSLNVVQTYQVRNQGQETTLQLGLPAAEGLPDYTLRVEGGQTLEPGASDASYARTWAVGLGRNEQKRLILTSSHPAQQGKLIGWRCEMSGLAPWGAIQGARLEYLFPQPVTDEAFLVTEPGNAGVAEGGLLYWDYETLQAPPNMQVVALSPATWQELQAFRQGQQHRDLALLYEALYKEAQEKGLPMADPYPYELGEWMAALGANPEDQDARQNLARLYRARAEAIPSLRLNYLLLLAEQLDALVQRTGNVETANELVRVYEEASRISSENNDAAGALKYLRLASAVPQVTASGGQQVLALRLALSLAQEGQVAEALQQVQDILSPDLRQTLVRYIPPYSSAHSEVSTGPQERVARYQLDVYPPAAEKVRVRLSEIALALRAIQGCQTEWQFPSTPANEVLGTAPMTATFTISVDYASLADLKERSEAIAENLQADSDLISTFLAAPWSAAPTIYGVEHGLWQDYVSYESEAELASPRASWEEGSDYVRWQLVELQSSIPSDERAQVERQLALLILEQQGQIWELIPSGTYSVHNVTYTEFPTYRPTWLLSWGQERVLDAHYAFYSWKRILVTAGAALILLAIILSSILRRL